jgi:hypothetical protein
MLKLDMYGQNDGTTVPNVVLTGTPGVDQTTLTNAGYLGGKVMAMVGTYSADGFPLIAPCDAYTMNPYGLLANGPGEFAGAIGPSGSKKAPIFRAMLKGRVDSQAYAGSGFVAGHPIYCGAGVNSGLMVATAPIIPLALTNPSVVLAQVAAVSTATFTFNAAADTLFGNFVVGLGARTLITNPTPTVPTALVPATATYTFAAAGDTVIGSFVINIAAVGAVTTVIPARTTLGGAVTLLNTAGNLPAGVTASVSGASIVFTGIVGTGNTLTVSATAVYDVVTTTTTIAIPDDTTLPAAVLLLNALPAAGGLSTGVVATNPGAGATIVLTGSPVGIGNDLVITGTSLFDVKATGGVAVPPIGICMAPPSATNSFFLQFASLL